MDTFLSWLGIVMVGGAVAWFAARAARRMVRREEVKLDSVLTWEYEPTTHVKVVSVESEFDQKIHSTAYHHPMERRLVHTWPVEGCACNNGHRKDGIVLASEELTELSIPPPGTHPTS